MTQVMMEKAREILISGDDISALEKAGMMSDRMRELVQSANRSESPDGKYVWYTAQGTLADIHHKYEVVRDAKAKNEVAERFARAAAIKVGDGMTECLWTDCQAYTVIEISQNGKTITLQRDKATRLTKPEFIPGGFVAHCTNNNEIKYSYEADPNGSIEKASLRKDGRFKTVNGSSTWIHGRHEHYDYNF